MKNLIVVDLDKTLIKKDSFSMFLLHWIKYYPLKLSLIILLRVFRIIGDTEFKRRVVHICKSNNNFDIFIENFTEKLDVLKNEFIYYKIMEIKDKDDLVLLLSASPKEYVEKFAEKLNWNGVGSYFDENGDFQNLKGHNKLKYLKKNYPQNIFNYKFAIGDSQSDLIHMKLFNQYLKL